MRPKERFPWGQIVEEWEIGPYHIAAYRLLPADPLNFHIWVDGRDTNTSSSTLEGALIVAIAENTIGRHPDVSMVMRALKLKED